MPSDVINNLSLPEGIVINGNELYFAEFNMNQISKIDISNPNPIKTIVATGFSGPSGIALIDDFLFVAEWTSGKISKIDITLANPSPIDVITNLNNPTEVISNGDNLIVSEFSANKVITIDISNPTTPVVSDLITNINQPTGMFINGSDLYISVFGDNKIVKLSDFALSLQDLSNTNQKIKLFPNPASDFVTISGIEDNQNYSIFNNLGAKILNGKIINSGYINIENLASGLYILKFDNGNAIKFIKE